MHLPLVALQQFSTFKRYEYGIYKRKLYYEKNKYFQIYEIALNQIHRQNLQKFDISIYSSAHKT